MTDVFGILVWVLGAGAVIAAIHFLMTVLNLRRYRMPTAACPLPGADAAAATSAAPLAATQAGVKTGEVPAPVVSICIPARNEEVNLEACVVGLLASDLREIEVLVYDDQSTDGTPKIIDGLMAFDARVRRVTTEPLPEGWNGKQHACWRMSKAARGEWMLFTDADVRFAPACVSGALSFAKERNVGLASTFPRQIVKTLGEALLVPNIFFILFGYLPMGRMQRTKDPSASAGCGQFLFVRRDVYEKFGGHSAFKNSMHDGVKMPREVRKAGFGTDLFDGTNLVSCRMYRGLQQSWRGFAKNAYEGLGSLFLLVFLTIVNALGHMVPWIAAAVLAVMSAAGTLPATQDARASLVLAIAATWLGFMQRLTLAQRLALPLSTALTHPIGVLMMTLVQWYSYVLHVQGKREWRGRVATVS